MKNKLQIEMVGQTCRSARRRGNAALPLGAAFTLIEVMVVVALFSLIVIALMAVFNTTQNAFRASITQTDVLEGGRAAVDTIADDLKTMTPLQLAMTPSGYLNSWTNVNFYTQVQNGFAQPLPASPSSTSHINVMEDIFFIVRQNQTLTGIGYYVRTNETFNYPTENGLGNVGSLYRYETNVSVGQFSANPAGLAAGFNLARDGNPPTNTVSRILDGVMSLRVRAFNPEGYWLTNDNLSGNIVATNNLGYDNWGEIWSYTFYSNAVPASVEIELGVLEDRALQRVESLPTAPLQDNYLSNHVGQVHIFRQQIVIPNADPSAYQ